MQKHLFWLLVGTVVPLAMTSPATASPLWRRPHAPFVQDQARPEREARAVIRDLAKAQYKANQARAFPQSDAELLRLADRYLTLAQQHQQNGRYFQARETAKAATRLYEAARNLGEARSGQVLDGLSRSYYDAPFQVSRELLRTEAEMSIFRSNDATITALVNQARQLARPINPGATATPTIADLAQNRAAVQLLKASRHLMRAERGF
ncbi:MAG: hypothetical protein Q6L54_03185 [Gloeomargarita sp. HHBFW_bins_205]